MENGSHIPMLSELTKKLPSIPIGSPGQRIYSDDGATIIGHALCKTEEIAIQRVYLEAGATFPSHRHSEKEWLVVFHGELRFQMEGETTIMGVGSCRFIREGIGHSVEALEDSQVIAITIPASEEFPDAR